jgi:hypothetical protein
MTADIDGTIAVVRRVQAMPYTWPAPPDAASARTAVGGSCASKHALLAEELAAIGLQSLPMFVVGPLVPQMLKSDPELAPGAHLSEGARMPDCAHAVGRANARRRDVGPRAGPTRPAGHG